MVCQMVWIHSSWCTSNSQVHHSCYHTGVDENEIGAPRDLLTVFLDRDGVINEKMPEGKYVSNWSNFQILPGVPQAIRRLNHAGIQVLVVTNQRGVSLGLYTVADVNAIHSQLQELLSSRGAHVDDFFFCPHDRKRCRCRKPLPGLFEQAQARYPKISASRSVMIGDSLSDIEFGSNIGMRTIFVDGNRTTQKSGAERARTLATCCAGSLADAVDLLLEKPALRI